MKNIIMLLFSCFLCSCAVVPVVNSRVSLEKTEGMTFYLVGSPRYGIQNMIKERINENGYPAEILRDKRNIPVLTDDYRNTTPKQYLVTHDYEQITENNKWRLWVIILEFNPRGADKPVAFSTANGIFSSHELVAAVIDDIFAKAQR